jgi:hypothetical protein
MLFTALPALADSSSYRGSGKTRFWRSTDYKLYHRLDTIGVHQMPEKNPAWDFQSMVKFLQLEEIILFEDC